MPSGALVAVPRCCGHQDPQRQLAAVVLAAEEDRRREGLLRPDGRGVRPPAVWLGHRDAHAMGAGVHLLGVGMPLPIGL